ncbi:MAG: hypothetical protein R2932_47060 [Caldilineaceae bacterium]
MLRAQNAAAQQQGCTIIDQLAVEVQSSASGVTVKLANGKRLGAKKVLIAAGAFTNFHGLLLWPLPLLLKTEATIWADTETAERLRTMPAVGYNIDDPDIDDIYMAPPLRYPDGQYKIKLGCNTKGELWPATLTGASRRGFSGVTATATNRQWNGRQADPARGCLWQNYFTSLHRYPYPLRLPHDRQRAQRRARSPLCCDRWQWQRRRGVRHPGSARRGSAPRRPLDRRPPP